MERLKLIQRLIDARQLSTYLEIGVLGGSVFFPIRCKRKIAVDPEFKFNWKGRLGETARNLTNFNASFFEMNSDDFFAKEAPRLFANRTLDIALVDGMHEFSYALNDVTNCLKYLSAHGVIVMHDCNPQTKDAASSFDDWKRRSFDGYWNGDVWKVIPHLRRTRPDLDVFVADCDHGLGVITRRTGLVDDRAIPGYTSIAQLDYDDLERQREDLLNLQPASFLDGFIAKLENLPAY